MSFTKQILNGILIFKLDEHYTTEDFIYFWDIAMKDSGESRKVLNAENIIIDCSKLKGMEQTGGELFFLQQKFEKRQKGKFLFCGLDKEKENLFNSISQEVIKNKNFNIRNFSNCQKAIDFILLNTKK